MDTKLLSEWQKLSEGIAEFIELVKQLERECQAWKERAETAEQTLEWLQDFTMSAKITEAAENEGLQPKQWIAEKLANAVEKNTDLPIDPRIHEMFVSMARGRSISLTELGKSVNMTDLFMELFDNRRI